MYPCDRIRDISILLSEMNKLDIGWFSFTCCEDSTIIFTELLNRHYETWNKVLNFKHVRVLNQQNKDGLFDVSFIEGAISSDKQADRVKEIRNQSKYIVAIGACAVMGMPSSQRNQFTAAQNAEIQFLLDRFNYNDKVLRVEDVIKVDFRVPGCPMNEKIFLQTIDQLISKIRLDLARSERSSL